MTENINFMCTYFNVDGPLPRTRITLVIFSSLKIVGDLSVDTGVQMADTYSERSLLTWVLLAKSPWGSPRFDLSVAVQRGDLASPHEEVSSSPSFGAERENPENQYGNQLPEHGLL